MNNLKSQSINFQGMLYTKDSRVIRESTPQEDKKMLSEWIKIMQSEKFLQGARAGGKDLKYKAGKDEFIINVYDNPEGKEIYINKTGGIHLQIANYNPSAKPRGNGRGQVKASLAGKVQEFIETFNKAREEIIQRLVRPEEQILPKD